MNKIFILITLTLAGCAFKSPVGESDHEFTNLIWADEFSDQTLDTSKWNIITGNGCPDFCGFGNNELQYYSDDTSNLFIQDGKLVIRAQKDSVGDNPFTSAKILTKNKGDWKYGRMEMRAKVPDGLGTWAAFWMMPSKGNMKWPNDGEIDIMEHVGFNAGTIYGAIHTRDHNGIYGNQRVDSLKVTDATSGFHVYALEWNQDRLTWFIDGEPYETQKRIADVDPDWPFEKKFHIIINLAVGGNWGGMHGVATDSWPQDYVIDYVRVYQ